MSGCVRSRVFSGFLFLYSKPHFSKAFIHLNTHSQVSIYAVPSVQVFKRKPALVRRKDLKPHRWKFFESGKKDIEILFYCSYGQYCPIPGYSTYQVEPVFRKIMRWGMNNMDFTFLLLLSLNPSPLDGSRLLYQEQNPLHKSVVSRIPAPLLQNLLRSPP